MRQPKSHTLKPFSTRDKMTMDSREMKNAQAKPVRLVVAVRKTGLRYPIDGRQK